jgi:hypothetical protein
MACLATLARLQGEAVGVVEEIVAAGFAVHPSRRTDDFLDILQAA